MAKWQIAFALLVVAALAHIVGVVRQIRHYRQVFGELGARWKDSRIGVGAAGAGVIAIVVLDQAGVVQAVQVRQGRGIFGKFQPRDDLEHLDAQTLRARIAEPGRDALVGQALGAALADLELKGRDRLP
jgi:DNA-binding transcriptional regulator of glucitol operon